MELTLHSNGQYAEDTVCKVALVSCVKSKRTTPAPAEELYISPLFLKSRAAAQAMCDRWFILSAEYGLLPPTTVVAPYERTLKAMGKREKKAWAQGVYGQMSEAGLLSPSVSFVWFAGRDYKADLSSLLTGHPQEDPMQDLSIGYRLQWLTRHAL